MDILRGGWAPGLLGNGAGLRADSPSTGGYSTEAEAIFAAFTTPPTTARKNLIDACVVSLKSAGVWTKLDALYAFAAADSQAAKVNWVNPGTYNATEVNAPAFAADQGFTGASTKYLDSNFNISTAPSPKWVQDSANLFGWSLTSANVTTGTMVGAAATRHWINPRNGDATNIAVNGNGTGYAYGLAGVLDGSGLFCANRVNASGYTYYRNAASLSLGASGSFASAAPISETLWFLRYQSAYWTGQIAAGGFGSQLSAADNTALYNALNTYLAGVGAVASYQAETNAIAAAFTTPPTTGRKNLIDAAVVSLKAAGVWAKLDALYVFAAADSQAAKVNWVAPGTYNCTEVNAPAFAADLGFTGSNTVYIDSNFNPTTATTPKFVQNSACAFAYSNNNLNFNAGMIGGAGGGLAMTIAPRWTDGNAYARINIGSGGPTTASVNSTGLWSIDRSASNLSTLYKNGASVATDAGASIAPFNEKISILYGNAAFWPGGQCSTSGFGQSLNSTEQTALYNALRTYMTGVGVP